MALTVNESNMFKRIGAPRPRNTKLAAAEIGDLCVIESRIRDKSPFVKKGQQQGPCVKKGQ